MRNSYQTTGYLIHASEGGEGEIVIASEFEYRHRFAIVAFVFVFAYAFYNLDPLNTVYAIVPRDLGVPNQDILARFRLFRISIAGGHRGSPLDMGVCVSAFQSSQ